MNKLIDIVVFGASGYTGKYVVREAATLLSNNFTWAIAGRNELKLRHTLNDVQVFCNKNLSDIPIIIADVNDQRSLKEMAKQAKVVVNCCGPYRFFGEPVIKACLESHTHHVDVSGEPYFMELMQFKYDQAARESGIFIVSACGYDSIPADMGTLYLQRNFGGTVNSVKIYTKVRYLDDYEALGTVVNYATYESAIHGFRHSNDLKELRKKLFAEKLPKMKPTMKEDSIVHRAGKDVENKWSLSIPVADLSVIMRSQRHFHKFEKQRPIQVKTFKTFDSLSGVLKTIAAGLILRKMTSYKCGRDILLNYPDFFSFGYTSKDIQPSDEQNSKTVFESIFIGEGWKEIFDDPIKDVEIPINKKMVCRVTCVNPLYGVASKSALLCALTILSDIDKMPSTGGGVYSPSVAFKNTFLIKRLQDNGVTFEVLHTDEVKASKAKL